jgi:hypothetical protein
MCAAFGRFPSFQGGHLIRGCTRLQALNVETQQRFWIPRVVRRTPGIASNRFEPSFVFLHEVVDPMAFESKQQPNIVGNIAVQLKIWIE